MLVKLLEIAPTLIQRALPVAAVIALALVVRRAKRREAMNQSDLPGAATRPISTLAVLSPVVFLLGLMAQSRLLAAIAGFTLGTAAVVQIKRRGLRGRWLAWTGIALSALLLGFLLTGLILYAQLQGNIVTGHL